MITKIVNKCVKLNKISGKPIAFFSLSPHVSQLEIWIYADGWTSENADKGMCYRYRYDKNTQRYHFKDDGYWCEVDVDIINILDTLIENEAK